MQMTASFDVPLVVRVVLLGTDSTDFASNVKTAANAFSPDIIEFETNTDRAFLEARTKPYVAVPNP